MPELNDHTKQVITSFFMPERRERFLSLARSARGRAKLQLELAHLRSIDPRYAKQLPGNLRQIESIAQN